MVGGDGGWLVVGGQYLAVSGRVSVLGDWCLLEKCAWWLMLECWCLVVTSAHLEASAIQLPHPADEPQAGPASTHSARTSAQPGGVLDPRGTGMYEMLTHHELANEVDGTHVFPSHRSASCNRLTMGVFRI